MLTNVFTPWIQVPARESVEERALKAAMAATVGAVVGRETIAAMGFKAVGMMGGGAGIGAAVGPVGAAVGALTGLAGYGLYHVFSDN
jgi:hypothetical protein